MTAHRRAWELANGPVPLGNVVLPCPDQPLCVRVGHLGLAHNNATKGAARRRRAKSVRVQVQVNGVRAHRRVRGGRTDVESTKALLREQLQRASPQDRDASRWSLNDLLDRYLIFLHEQGRELR